MNDRGDRAREERPAEPRLIIGPTSGGPDVELELGARILHGPLRADADIASDVGRRLAEHGSLGAAVRVGVSHGFVTLDGTVADAPARHVASVIADAVPGVRGVANHLGLRG